MIEALQNQTTFHFNLIGTIAMVVIFAGVIGFFAYLDRNRRSRGRHQ